MQRREIKFRIWDNINKVMDPIIYKVGEQFGHPSSADWIYMEYTGLKDSREVEIFEGDILKLSKHTDGNPVVVSMGNGSWIAGNWGELYGALKYAEVIGNIYENENLLVKND